MQPRMWPTRSSRRRAQSTSACRAHTISTCSSATASCSSASGRRWSWSWRSRACVTCCRRVLAVLGRSAGTYALSAAMSRGNLMLHDLPCKDTAPAAASKAAAVQAHGHKSSMGAVNMSRSSPGAADKDDAAADYEAAESSFSSISSTPTSSSEEQPVPDTAAAAPALRSSIFLTTHAIPLAQVMKIASAVLEAATVRACDSACLPAGSHPTCGGLAARCRATASLLVLPKLPTASCAPAGSARMRPSALRHQTREHRARRGRHR